MKDYKTRVDYNHGYRSSPEVVVLAIVGAYFVTELSWLEIANFFSF